MLNLICLMALLTVLIVTIVGVVKYVKDMREQNAHLQVALRESTRKLDNVQAELYRVMTQLNEAEWELERNASEVEAQADLQTWRAQIDHAVALLNDYNEQIRVAKESELRARHEMDELAQKVASARAEAVALQASLDAMRTFHHEAVLRDRGERDQSGRTFELDACERKFVEALTNLRALYFPQDVAVNEALASVEWKKVWMPRLQQIARADELDGKCGIYKLTRLDDESVCYIGQAVNIKERWYQHAKKMIGVDKSGGEKLYKEGVRPDQFRWEVIEEVDDRGCLNERERYWIDWYAAVEVGLNGRR